MIACLNCYLMLGPTGNVRQKQVARVFWEQAAIKRTRLKPADTDATAMTLAVSKVLAFGTFCLPRVVVPLLIARYLLNSNLQPKKDFGLFSYLDYHLIFPEVVGE